MNKYEQRYVAPSYDDKMYISTLYGGKSECIVIDSKTGSVLPNCVGYAWSRAYEWLGERPRLSKANAENWFGYTADGYQRSQKAQVGSIACWYGPGDLCGHVAFVEQVNKDGSIEITESSYGGVRWERLHLNPPFYFYGLVFQGFIILPMSKLNEKGATDFVENLYQSLFNRKADKGNQWAYKIINRIATPADVVNGFFNSPEYTKKKTDDMTFINDAYRAILARKGESSGVKYWKTVIEKGGSRRTVVMDFCRSQEFINRCKKLGIL